MSKSTYACDKCGRSFQAREADRMRGWGRFCSKSCAKLGKTDKPSVPPTLEPVAWRTRYRAEEGMIGSYPIHFESLEEYLMEVSPKLSCAMTSMHVAAED